MPITRTPIPGGEPDETGRLPYQVIGTNKAEKYVTQADGKTADAYADLKGGNDTLTLDGVYIPGEYAEFEGHGGKGNDRMVNPGISGPGLYGDAGNDRITTGAGDGASLASGGPGNDILRSTGADEPNGLFGGTGNDKLYASERGDLLAGGAGKDVYWLPEPGPGGSDGDDTLYFQYEADTGIGGKADLVHGFDPDQDRINLSDIDANPGVGGDQAFAWVGNTAGTSGVDVGEIGWFTKGHDAVVAFRAAERNVIVLDGLAEEAAAKLGAADFVL